MIARDVMTPEVVTVRPETPVPEIARLMAARDISGVPVVDENDCLVGVVTEDDLLLKHDRAGAPHRLALFGLWVVPEEALEKAYCSARCTAKASDVMTRDIITFDEDADVDTIAETMVRRKINRVPILRGSKLVGIVTRANILESIAGIRS
jgi:CBS domain-containing protein